MRLDRKLGCMAGTAGLEPTTSGLAIPRSIRLSYVLGRLNRGPVFRQRRGFLFSAASATIAHNHSGAEPIRTYRMSLARNTPLGVDPALEIGYLLDRLVP